MSEELSFDINNIQIILLQLIRLHHYYWFATSEQDEPYAYLRLPVYYFVLLWLIHAVLKQMQVSLHSPLSIAENIHRTRQNVGFFKSQHELESRLKHIYYPSHGEEKDWYYTGIHSTGRCFAFHIKASDASLNEQVTIFSKLSDSLDKQYHASSCQWREMGRPPRPPGTQPTTILNFIKKWMPVHWAAGVDMPTKARLIDMMFFCNLFKFGDFLSTLKFVFFQIRGIEQSSITLRSDSSAVLLLYLLFAFHEARLLQDQKKQLAFRGIERRVADYYAFPPTCFGQQLTAQHVFVGHSTTIQAHTLFLIDMVDYIQKLEMYTNDAFFSQKDRMILQQCVDACRTLQTLLYVEDGVYYNGERQGMVRHDESAVPEGLKAIHHYRVEHLIQR